MVGQHAPAYYNRLEGRLAAAPDGRLRPQAQVLRHVLAEGSLYVGSPETVARKIAATVRALGASRFDLKYSAGTLPHEAMMRSIELYGDFP